VRNLKVESGDYSSPGRDTSVDISLLKPDVGHYLAGKDTALVLKNQRHKFQPESGDFSNFAHEQNVRQHGGRASETIRPRRFRTRTTISFFWNTTLSSTEHDSHTDNSSISHSRQFSIETFQNTRSKNSQLPTTQDYHHIAHSPPSSPQPLSSPKHTPLSSHHITARTPTLTTRPAPA
jgi:hypothetical protein